jgi:hypothetical protein
MTAIIFDTESREAPCSLEKRVEAVSAASHLAMINRLCQFALDDRFADYRRRRNHRPENWDLDTTLQPLMQPRN